MGHTRIAMVCPSQARACKRRRVIADVPARIVVSIEQQNQQNRNKSPDAVIQSVAKDDMRCGAIGARGPCGRRWGTCPYHPLNGSAEARPPKRERKRAPNPPPQIVVPSFSTGFETSVDSLSTPVSCERVVDTKTGESFVVPVVICCSCAKRRIIPRCHLVTDYIVRGWMMCSQYGGSCDDPETSFPYYAFPNL